MCFPFKPISFKWSSLITYHVIICFNNISILKPEVPTILEHFLIFVVVSDLSGSSLASVILENLKK